MSEPNPNQPDSSEGVQGSEPAMTGHTSQWPPLFWNHPSNESGPYPPNMYWNPFGPMVPPPQMFGTQYQTACPVAAPPPPVSSPSVNLHQPTGTAQSLDEIQSTPSHDIQNPAAKRTKEQNFKPEEDILLCNSWCQITNDPVINTGQRKEGFWSRIGDRYNQNRGEYPKRVGRALSSRFDKIRAECSKFAGYHAKVLRENPSGLTEHDKTIRAASNYARDEKHGFMYMHCWEILKNEPKWQTGGTETTFYPFQGGSQGMAGSPFINVDDIDSSSPTSSGKRPLGRDSSKRSSKKAQSTSSESSDALSLLHELSVDRHEFMREAHLSRTANFENILDVEKAKVQMEKERLQEQINTRKSIEERAREKMEIEKEKLKLKTKMLEINEKKEAQKELERIWCLNWDVLPQQAREYYEKKQKDLLEFLQST